MALRRMFQSGGAKEHRAFTLQLNDMRLADMALREYSSGRDAVLEFHAERQGMGITSVLRASGHFEGCIWALERFGKHIKVLRGALFAHTDLKQFGAAQY